MNFVGPVPLYRPGEVLECQHLLQWACEANIIVEQRGCANYQSSRIKFATELKIHNWRSFLL